MARELLIQDGKLTSDLDADHKTIKNLEGFAALDESGKVPASQLPSYVDDVLEFPATTDFPASGETDKIYVATSTSKVYRWSGSQYIEIANPDLSGYVNGGSYDSTSKKILLKHDSSTIAEIDATAFIKDGMVSSVAISNGKLVITFNTDAGLEPIEIPLTDIFNPANYYDKTATNTLLSGKSDKVANATSGNLAALDSNGDLADSGMALRDFAVAKSLAPAFVPYNAYEVGDLCTSFDNDSNHKGTWLYKCILATDGSQFEPPEINTTHWALATVEDVLAALRTAVAGKQDALSAAQLANIAVVPNKVGSFASVGGASATVEKNGVAKLSDFFTESNSLLTATIDAEVISKGTAPDAHIEAPTDEHLRLILADNSVAYDSAKALPYKLTSVIGDRVIATMTLTAASTDITLPTVAANDTTVKDFILDVTNAYAVEGVATDAGINIPRTDFKLVTRDGESLTAVTTVKAGKSAFICFTQKSPVVVDGTTYPCWCVIQLPFGDPS